ncbi:hypothetical protein [Blastopirellula marina]|uniref:Uncharacterized protein n=1 Tax=Blastopirellula marina DSM 3645 TaxID=314230 RepID=A3ZQ85_9BACT|nr:hypothetical protein [Blastopirellula marina]EAQ81358.1 hypothetical protein DSM3645_23241 [Blastopirellula marina DSM 3645]
MSRLLTLIFLLALACCVVQPQAWAQEENPDPPAVAETAPAEEAPPIKEESAEPEVANEPKSDLPQQLDEIAKSVDHSEAAQETSAGILTPIYRVAEALEFPAFHWIAFALMLSGVVGFALQLVIGKLVVFAHYGFSLREILSDALGFVISAVGLVLTTQAAVQNSTFTQSPFAVISASLVGLLLGVTLYFWGQSQEVEAVRGRIAAAEESARKKK